MAKVKESGIAGTSATLTAAVISGLQSPWLKLDADLVQFLVIFTPIAITGLVFLGQWVCVLAGLNSPGFMAAETKLTKAMDFLKTEISEHKKLGLCTKDLEKQLNQKTLAKAKLYEASAES